MLKQSRRKKLLAAVGVSIVALIVASCSGAESTPGPTPTPGPTHTPEPPTATATLEPPTATATPEPPTATPTPSQPTPTPYPAPALAGTGEWINSEPFTLASRQGEVVLVDFWTYTCINCIRTLPWIRDWHEKYADAGLVILGVHTPEFEFEKIADNVRKASLNYDLNYPIVQDNEFTTWRAFKNRAWPSKYLIDANGAVRYAHIGEGAYDTTERWIRTLLEEAGADLSGISGETLAQPPRDVSASSSSARNQVTRELYAGTHRNYGAVNSQRNPPYVRHVEYYEERNVVMSYEDPGDHANQYIYLQGAWLNEAESLTHGRATENYEDYLGIRFFATSVNTVMSPGEAGEPYDVRVFYDDRPLTADEAGADVQWDAEGNSFVPVDEARMYGIVKIDEVGEHELRLSSNADNFSVFAYTFGTFLGDTA